MVNVHLNDIKESLQKVELITVGRYRMMVYEDSKGFISVPAIQGTEVITIEVVNFILDYEDEEDVSYKDRVG